VETRGAIRAGLPVIGRGGIARERSRFGIGNCGAGPHALRPAKPPVFSAANFTAGLQTCVVSKALGLGKRGLSYDFRFPLFPAPEKIQKQSWNVYDNKSLLFLESPQSWNVYENKDGYAKKLECP
jgi:hypothetical protein